MRGYFGIGIYHTKTEVNIGTLWRSAYNFGAEFIFTVGKRYKRQSSDTIETWRKIPLYHYLTFEDFHQNIPMDCQMVAVEQNVQSINLQHFSHPERAVYLLGAEDVGIPKSILSKFKLVVCINTPMCLNVAVAGSIVMYDRSIKA